MVDQLISYETAILAKEKGYNLPVHEYYQEDTGYDEPSGDWVVTDLDNEQDYLVYGNLVPKDMNNGEYDDFLHRTFSKCTQTSLQKWLREFHGVDAVVLPYKDHNDNVNDPNTYKPVLWSGLKGFEACITYEEALEKVLQEGLKEISIKKNER